MKFTELSLKGAYLIELSYIRDERGHFARSFCSEAFKKHGICHHYPQCNISFNKKAGTLRGMHYQKGKDSEAKLIRCTRGKVYDVIIDLRQESSTYMSWEAVELSQEDGKILYVPEHFAHGFYTLEDNTELFYQMSNFFIPESARGIHWGDPKVNITWPFEKPKIISEKDESYLK